MDFQRSVLKAIRARQFGTMALWVSICALQMVSVGCALTAVAPGPILETPTTATNAFSIGGQAGHRQGQTVTVTRSFSSRPVNLSQRDVGTMSEFYLGPQLTYRKVEAKIDLALWTGSVFRLKYQFLGPPADESKTGDFAGAVTVQAVGGSGRSSVGTQTGSVSDVGYSAEHTMSGSGIGLSAGYHLSERFLLYAGYTHMDYRLTYKIKQEASGSFPEGNYSGAENGYASVTGVGTQFFMNAPKRISANAAVTYQSRPWLLSSGNYSIGLDLGVNMAF